MAPTFQRVQAGPVLIGAGRVPVLASRQIEDVERPSTAATVLTLISAESGSASKFAKAAGMGCGCIVRSTLRRGGAAVVRMMRGATGWHQGQELRGELLPLMPLYLLVLDTDGSVNGSVLTFLPYPAATTIKRIG